MNVRPGTGRSGASIRRAAAVLALVLIALGLPLLLAVLGGLPFAQVDPFFPVRAATGATPVDLTTMTNWAGQVALVVAWSAWAWMATGVLLEIRYWVSGRSPLPLPAGRTMQWVVAGLVATAFALGGAARSSPAIQPVGSTPSASSFTVGTDAGAGQAPVAGRWMRSSSRSVPSEELRLTTPVAEQPFHSPEVPSRGTRAATPIGSEHAPGITSRDTPPPHLLGNGIHTVVGRETLWSIADDRLGAARRWKEIADMNYGRLQPDGGTLDGGHWIRAGWELVLPSLASVEPEADGAPIAAGPGPVGFAGTVAETDVHAVADEGDWRRESVHELTATPAPTSRRVPPASKMVPPDATAEGATTAAASFAGDEVFETPDDTTDENPTTTVASAVSVFPTKPPDISAASSSVGSAASQSSAPFGAPVVPPGPTLPIAPVGAGVVGVGVTGLIDRLRRVQQRNRLAGERITLPGPDLRRLEQRLRLGDGAAVLRAVDAAIGRFVASSTSADPVGAVRGVAVTDQFVELHLDERVDDDPVAPGFRAVDGKRAIGIDRRRLDVDDPALVSSRAPGAGRRNHVPGLVTVGRNGDRVVFVNLESFSTVAVAGSRADAEGVIRALALELATSDRASDVDLVLVGFGADLARFDRVTVTDAGGPLVADLAWRALRDAMRLEDLALDSVAAARAADPGGEWDPVVVICGPSVATEDVRALMDAARGSGRERSGGMTVMAIAATEDHFGAEWLLQAGPTAGSDRRTGREVLAVFDGLLVPQEVSASEVAGVGGLLDVATEGQRPDADGSGHETAENLDASTGAVMPPPEVSRSGAGELTAADDVGPVGVAALVGRIDRASVPVGGAVSRPDPLTSGSGPTSGYPGSEVEVAVLGPVEIRGAARTFTRAWSRELVVYLSMHPGPTPNDVWATALWPERVMAPSSLHSTVSVARRALGKAADGTDHLPRSHGSLALGPSVHTDWDRFEVLASSEDADAWREALSLVRGRPFEGLRSTDWSVLDGTAPALESEIVDLSGRLAGACLRAGDARGAEWSARRGLLVSPYDERLYRMLLRAADAAGNPSGVESVMAELVRVVADEIEPVESVHPSTLALYRSLSRRRIPAL